jgi:hypothetical protein
MKLFSRLYQAVEATEKQHDKLNTAYERTAIGKFDKKLDDKFDSWTSKLFGLEDEEPK